MYLGCFWRIIGQKLGNEVGGQHWALSSVGWVRKVGQAPSTGLHTPMAAENGRSNQELGWGREALQLHGKMGLGTSGQQVSHRGPGPQLGMGVLTSAAWIFICSWIEAAHWRSCVPAAEPAGMGIGIAKPCPWAAKHLSSSFLGACLKLLLLNNNTAALWFLEPYS